MRRDANALQVADVGRRLCIYETDRPWGLYPSPRAFVPRDGPLPYTALADFFAEERRHIKAIPLLMTKSQGLGKHSASRAQVWHDREAKLM